VKSSGTERIRAISVAAKICRAIAATLKDNPLSRDKIAQRMSDYLGQNVSGNMLDAYASQAREDHVINLVRFIALLHATQDRRLLEMIAEMFGWTVIERRFLKLIEVAALQEREDILRRQREALRREARIEGIL
jgi:hypothetical protein